MSDVSGYLIVSAKSSCRNITCESVPGSPPLFFFFVGARGEPGNEATVSLFQLIMINISAHAIICKVQIYNGLRESRVI